MRKAVLCLVLLFWIPLQARAQSSQYLENPRYEVGIQFDFHYLDGIGRWGGGFGPRFHYNFNEHFALDSELSYRQHNVSTFNGVASASGVIGQTTGLFGLRAGQRVQDYGFFAQARAGFLHFGTDHGVSLLTRNTFPAFNVGGTIEHYSGPVILRFDLGEMIVAYGNAQASPGPPVLPLQPPLGRLGTRASPVVGFGFAVRF